MVKRAEEAAGARRTPRPRARVRAAWASCAALFLCFAAPSQAQFEGFAPSDVRFFSLVVERPVHPASFDVSTVIGHVAYGVPVRPRITVVGGLSVVHAREPQLPTSTIVSNAWIEAHFGGDGGFGTLTITMPTSRRLANEEAYAIDAGIAAEVQLPERFARGTTGVAFRLNPRWSVGSSATVGARVGLAAVSPSSLPSEFYARFGGFGETALASVRVGAEVTGAWSLSPPSIGRDRTFGEVTTGQATVFVGLPDVPLDPHLFVRLPLDADARRRLRTAIGLRLTR